MPTSQLELIADQVKFLPPSDLVKLIKQAVELLAQNKLRLNTQQRPQLPTQQPITPRSSVPAKELLRLRRKPTISCVRSVINGKSGTEP